MASDGGVFGPSLQSRSVVSIGNPFGNPVMRRGGGGGVVIWHAAKIEGREEEEKNWKRRKRRSPSSCNASQASPHLPTSLISPSSCPRPPVSTSRGERPSRECETMRRKPQKKKKLPCRHLFLKSFLLLFMARENICRRVRCFRVLDLRKYECYKLRYNLGWRGWQQWGNFLIKFFFDFPPFSATIECTPTLLIPAAILCRQSPVPALRSKMPPTSLCAWPRLLGQQSSADLPVTSAGGFAAEGKSDEIKRHGGCVHKCVLLPWRISTGAAVSAMPW